MVREVHVRWDNPSLNRHDIERLRRLEHGDDVAKPRKRRRRSTDKLNPLSKKNKNHGTHGKDLER